MYKIEIYVRLKKDVLDPQGKAIKNAAINMGLSDIVEVNQGKYFEITIKRSKNADNAKTKAKELTENLLLNNVIEEYKIKQIKKI